MTIQKPRHVSREASLVKGKMMSRMILVSQQLLARLPREMREITQIADVVEPKVAVVEVEEMIIDNLITREGTIVEEEMADEVAISSRMIGGTTKIKIEIMSRREMGKVEEAAEMVKVEGAEEMVMVVEDEVVIMMK